MGEEPLSARAPGERPTARPIDRVPFAAHVELLQFFLAHRAAIVGRIQGLLNVQRKPPQYLRDRHLLSRRFEDCFFTLTGVTADQAGLRGQLEEAHWSRGFRPRETPGVHNDLVDSAEMMMRAFHLWTQTRWPGSAGRDRYAHTLFNLYLLRQLALLSMRVWDAGASSAGERLAQVQSALDALWKTSPPDQPVLVRDARWLIPVALSPATEELAPYFEVAERIGTAFSDDDRIAILDPVVRMAGGHLRSYLHYYVTQKGMALAESGLVSLTRKSNALDFSLLIHGLVPLLAAYERAVDGGDSERRLALADAICQGVSPDPELLINRVDLLGAYTMVEHLFTTTAADGHVVYTPTGQRHVQLLDEYAARIARLAKPLYDDCGNFRPVDGGYSPYGVLYGFSSNLLEHMALKILQPDAVIRFGLEDVFSAGDADKLAWVSGWRKLPHVDPEVQKLYAYPQRFAEQIFDRVERALRKGAARDEASAGGGDETGRLFVVREAGSATESDDSAADANASEIPDLPLRYGRTSDTQIVATRKADAYDQKELLSDRLEGHFVVSYKTSGGWVAISKDFLTEVLGAGRDAKIDWLPSVAVETLRLMCRTLVVLRESEH